jgi:Flp pilus assembly protein TadB
MLEIFYNFVKIIIFVFIFLALYQFALIAFKCHSHRTSAVIRDIVNRQKLYNAKSIQAGLSEIISNFVVMTDYKRSKLAENLKIANIPLTPETYTAESIVVFLKYALIAVIFLFIFPLFSMLFFTLAFLKYLQSRDRILKSIRLKREQIDLDLPRFVNSIVQELRDNHDVVSIFERHKDNYSESFSNEIAITIADMRTGNYEAALQRFEGRVGSASLSEVVRGLIEMVKGNDTHIYWETLSFRFSEMQKENLRRLAKKVPGKVNKLSFVLMLTFILLYVFVLGYQIITNIGTMF